MSVQATFLLDVVEAIKSPALNGSTASRLRAHLVDDHDCGCRSRFFGYIVRRERVWLRGGEDGSKEIQRVEKGGQSVLSFVAGHGSALARTVRCCQDEFST
jgi:hypothetical protein